MNIINAIRLHGPLILAGFNQSAAQNFVKQYTDPFFNFLLWAAPVAAMISCVASGIVYMLKEEDERDRHKFSKTLKRIILVAVVVESISIIFTIVGIATG